LIRKSQSPISKILLNEYLKGREGKKILLRNQGKNNFKGQAKFRVFGKKIFSKRI